jgi:NADH-quinone oxidoreductase subunit A
MGDYLPILILAIIAAAFGIGSLVASSLLAPKKPTPAKYYPYECGIIPERLPQGERFPVKFYVVAMIFIIFDIETIFLFPWAVAFRHLGMFGLIEMTVFILLVFVAYAYIWKKGGLDWGEGVGAEAVRKRQAANAAAAEARTAAAEVARAG